MVTEVTISLPDLSICWVSAILGLWIYALLIVSIAPEIGLDAEFF
jgi:hypothetical protein